MGEDTMQKLRKLLAPVGLAFAFGMIGFGLQAASPQVQVKIDPGWRYTDGYWNYYHPEDRAWYYTNGQNWYTYDNNAWKIYNFDKKFGTDSFYREGYKAPKPGPDVVMPRHKVYVPK